MVPEMLLLSISAAIVTDPFHVLVSLKSILACSNVLLLGLLHMHTRA